MKKIIVEQTFTNVDFRNDPVITSGNRVVFHKCTFQGCNFSGMNLSNCVFQMSTVVECDFINVLVCQSITKSVSEDLDRDDSNLVDAAYALQPMYYGHPDPEANAWISAQHGAGTNRAPDSTEWTPMWVDCNFDGAVFINVLIDAYAAMGSCSFNGVWMAGCLLGVDEKWIDQDGLLRDPPTDVNDFYFAAVALGIDCFYNVLGEDEDRHTEMWCTIRQHRTAPSMSSIPLLRRTRKWIKVYESLASFLDGADRKRRDVYSFIRQAGEHAAEQRGGNEKMADAISSVFLQQYAMWRGANPRSPLFSGK